MPRAIVDKRLDTKEFAKWRSSMSYQNHLGIETTEYEIEVRNSCLEAKVFGGEV